MSEKRRVSLGTKKRAWSRESLDWKEWQESSRERRGAGTPKQMSALHQNKKISFLYLKNVRWPNLNPFVFFFAGVGAELAGFWAPECDAVWLTLSLFDSPLQSGLVNDDTVRSSTQRHGEEPEIIFTPGNILSEGERRLEGFKTL